MVDKEINKVKQCCHYKLHQWKKKVTSDIFNDTSEHVALVQLMDTAGDINHAVINYVCWIYDSNCEK